MTFVPKLATASALCLILAACGGGADETPEPAATSSEVAAAEDVAPVADETPVAEETPAAVETPAAAPSPAATPTSAATPAAAAPAPVAAAGPPASFAQCRACHAVEPGKHGLGPSLAGIWGDKAAEVPGFEFSDAMKNSGLVWNQANLDKYLADPRGTVPGTKMAFGGVKDAAKRQELIDYIRGL